MKQPKATEIHPAEAIRAIQTAAPRGSFILITPGDSMFVSPDPAEINKALATFISQQSEVKNGHSI